jgi:hypothetical protein
VAANPLIRGQEYDFSHIALAVGTREFVGIKEINYNHKLEPGMSRGTQAQVMGRTRGQYECEGSLTLYRRFWPELRELLGEGFMEAEFTVTCSYSNGSDPIQTDTLASCRIKSVDASNSEGSDPLVVKLDLSIMYILENGVAPLSNMKR